MASLSRQLAQWVVGLRYEDLSPEVVDRVMWDFDDEGRCICDVIPVLPIPAAQSEEIIATCRDLDRHERAAKLIELTLKQG